MASVETHLDRCIQAFEAIKLIRSTYASSEDGVRMVSDIIKALAVGKDDTHPQGSISEGVSKVLDAHFVNLPDWKVIEEGNAGSL